MPLLKSKRKNTTPVNAGSMADIAFLLLIFFLVTTTIEVETGILSKLPVWDPNPIVQPLPDRNVLSIKINAANEVLVEGNKVEVEGIKEKVVDFILNPQDDPDLSTAPENAVVSLQNDRGTSYNTYIMVYNELKSAYTYLHETTAQQLFGKQFDDLSIADKKHIKKKIPLLISESEPTAFAE